MACPGGHLRSLGVSHMASCTMIWITYVLDSMTEVLEIIVFTEIGVSLVECFSCFIINEEVIQTFDCIIVYIHQSG